MYMLMLSIRVMFGWIKNRHVDQDTTKKKKKSSYHFISYMLMRNTHVIRMNHGSTCRTVMYREKFTWTISLDNSSVENDSSSRQITELNCRESSHLSRITAVNCSSRQFSKGAIFELIWNCHKIYFWLL